MAIRKFLAQQEASFVSLSDLLEQIEATEGCTLREACRALFSYMDAAGDQAPAWLKWDKHVGPVEAEGDDLVVAELSAAWVMSELGDQDSSLLNRQGKTANESNRDILHAQQNPRYGFDAAQVYSLLRCNGVDLPEASAVLGPLESDGTARRHASPPLTREDKREIVRLRGDGVSVRKIAAKFGKTTRTIYDVLDDAQEGAASPGLTIASWRRE